jgi:hypothetical protein
MYSEGGSQFSGYHRLRGRDMDDLRDVRKLVGCGSELGCERDTLFCGIVAPAQGRFVAKI